jgi:hypothetical protein
MTNYENATIDQLNAEALALAVDIQVFLSISRDFSQFPDIAKKNQKLAEARFKQLKKIWVASRELSYRVDA